MARRVKQSRKEQLRELEAPEIVEENLWSLSHWMEKHWRPVLGGIAVVSVIWGGIGIVQIVSSNSEQKRAEATAAVFLAATTAVVPPPEKPPEPAEGEETPKKDAPKKDEAPTFVSDKDRAAAIVKAAVGEDAKGKPWADLVIGAAKAQAGDYAAQLAAIDVALKQVAGQPLELALRDQRATALAAMGKTAEAVTELDKLAKDAPTNFAKANAQLRIGDLYNPALGSKAADAGRAKGAYEAALKAAQVNEKDTPRGAVGYVVLDARGKLARL